MPPTVWLQDMGNAPSNTEHWGSRCLLFSWDDSEEPQESKPGVISAVIVVVFLEQFFLPGLICFFLWLCRFCKKSPQTEGYREIGTRFQDELSRFDKRYPIQTPRDCSTQMLAEITDIEKRLVTAVDNLRAQRRIQKAANMKTISPSRMVSIHSYISFIIWVVYVAVSFSVRPEQNADLVRILGYVGIALMILHYVIMLIESYSCSEKKYLTNLSSVISAVEYIDRIKNAQPSVHLLAECYHYESRSRTVTSTDMHGNTSTSQESYDERVVTANIREPFIFQLWQDHSQAALVGIHKKKITKIKMELQVLLGDVETAKDFAERYSKFKEENQHRDTYVDFSVSRTVPDFNSRLAAYVEASDKSWWINSWCFWLSTVLWLGWIYRLAFKYSTAKTTFNVIKSIYVTQPAARNVNNRNSAEVQLTQHREIEFQNIVDNSHDMKKPDSSQFGYSFTITKRNIEAILGILETSDVEDSLPLTLVNDTEFRNVTMANPSQLREAVIEINS